MSKKFEFQTTAEFVEWLDKQQNNFDFKTKTYKFDEQFAHQPDGYKSYFVLETHYGTGFSGRYITIVLPQEVADLLKTIWVKENDTPYSDYKGRRTLAAVLNFLRKNDPNIAQTLEIVKVRQQMTIRRNTIANRLISLNSVADQLTTDFASGTLFVDQNYFDALHGLIDSLNEQMKAIDLVLSE